MVHSFLVNVCVCMHARTRACGGMIHSGSCQPVTMGAWVQREVGQCGVFGGNCVTGTGFAAST
jgi:hypothetical protein